MTRTLARPACTIAAALALALAAFAAQDASAAYTDNTTCKGHIQAGPKDETGLMEHPVQYRFACSNPITGYSIIADRQLDAYDTEVFVFDALGIVPSDSFSCNGDTPGWGVNCVGTYGGNQRVVEGVFNLADAPMCRERRVDPILTVAYASYAKNADGSVKKDSKGNPIVTQSMAGPFDLGRPRGCPATKFSGRTHIPVSHDTPAESSRVRAAAIRR